MRFQPGKQISRWDRQRSALGDLILLQIFVLAFETAEMHGAELCDAAVIPAIEKADGVLHHARGLGDQVIALDPRGLVAWIFRRSGGQVRKGTVS